QRGEWPVPPVSGWTPSTTRAPSTPRSLSRRRPRPRQARRTHRARAGRAARGTSRSTGSRRPSFGGTVLALHSVNPRLAGVVEVLLRQQIDRIDLPDEDAPDLPPATADPHSRSPAEAEVLARACTQAGDLRRRHAHSAVVTDDHIQVLRHGGHRETRIFRGCQGT